MLVRQDIEAREREELSGMASCSCDSRGRRIQEVPDLFRTAYQRDRDRILHSKSFRRLAHKTQVFLAPEGDHYRTRLTHTLEVAQISRDICRSLGLNEDLCEAIALGHDLGHTPFGHTGEDALSRCIAAYRGVTTIPAQQHFHHNIQSVRVVALLEKNGVGLNLTQEVLNGIACHTGAYKAFTSEGQVVSISDRIAYITHDIDDAQRAGLLRESDLPAQCVETLGNSATERITTMVQDLVRTSSNEKRIMMSPPIWQAMMELRTFLTKHIYTVSDAKVEEPKANRLIEELFNYYIAHLDEVPVEYRIHNVRNPEIQVADYVSGMTDRFAVKMYEEIKIPHSWRLGGRQ